MKQRPISAPDSSIATTRTSLDPDLVEVIAAWNTLPAALRAAILAIVKAI